MVGGGDGGGGLCVHVYPATLEGPSGSRTGEGETREVR